MSRHWSSNPVRLVALTSVLALTTALAGCGKERPKPGNVRAEARAATAGRAPLADRLDALLEPTNGVILSSAATVRPRWESRAREIAVSGVVTYDTRRIYTVAARIGGRIERLYMRSGLEPIRKGQRLLEIYSPELVTAQRELLYLLDADAGNAPLIAAATQKLRFLGVPDGHIDELQRTRQVSYAVAVLSPYSGYVLDGTGVTGAPTSVAAPSPAPTGGGMPDGMGGGAASGSTPDGMPSASMTAPAGNTPAGGALPGTPLLLREGQYVQPGQTLLRVVDPEQLWVDLHLSTHEAAEVRPGTPVTLTFDHSGSEPYQTTVSTVVPVYDPNQHYAMVRATVARRPSVRVGQLVRGVIHQPQGHALWLPASAVLDLGDRQVVFRKEKEGNAFRPVTVAVTARTTGMVAIQGGVTERDEVATNAQFLVDSESFVPVRDGRRP